MGSVIEYNNLKHNMDDEQSWIHHPNEYTIEQLDINWLMLEQMCIHNPNEFIEQLSTYDAQVLNYTKKSRTRRITLFWVALCTKNYALVKSMLESDMFTVSTLNQPMYGISPFEFACSKSVEIAFLMLNSDKILPSTINAVHGPFFHPIKQILCVKSTMPEYSDNIRNFELAMRSNKFLDGCSELHVREVCRSFMANKQFPEVIRIVLNNEKFTREIIEQTTWFHGTIIEEYSRCENAEPLKILLDSEKITVDFVESCYFGFDIVNCKECVQNVIQSHPKCANICPLVKCIPEVSPSVEITDEEKRILEILHNEYMDRCK